MNDQHDPDDPENGAATAPEGERLRFKGIVEPQTDEVSPAAWRGGVAAPVAARARRQRTDWPALSRQTLVVTRVIAAFWFAAVCFGWPLGDYIAYRQTNGGAEGWSLAGAVSFEAFLLVVVAVFLTLLVGYIASRLLQTVGAAETIAVAAQQLVSPDEHAAENVRHVGAAVRGQMQALNVGLDGALTRLASVEAMIRQHVEAIEDAGASIETRATTAMSRIADERARLIDLTEHLNRQADAFAAAIAAKAQASIEALHSADDLSERAQAHLEDRLARLDAAANTALQSFTALGRALEAADDQVRASAGRIDASTLETRRAAEQAGKAAEAAAESAARNAANVGAAAARAAADAQQAAEKSIHAAKTEAGRAADAAVEATEREANRIAEAAGRALESVKRSTQSALEAASKDAARATSAADQMSDAARRAAEASARAADEVAKASEAARRNAAEALSLASDAGAKTEARNAALANARAALEQENVRLESLIDEQRKRADRLADAIATQTERLSKLAETQIREQEANARLADAQAALKARAAADEERRAAQLEAQAAAERAQTAQPQPGGPEQPEPAPALDLGEAARAKTGGKQKNGAANGAARQRLDDLADDIAQRRGRNGRKEPPLTGAADKPRDKQNTSWREILSATDEAEPLDLASASVTPPRPAAGAPNAAGAIRIIGELQSFTFDLETRLYGDPPATLRERFERGDRNVFANRLLRLNEADVKRRIRSETGRDKAFERDLHDFLQGFEKLLEDATTSQTADEDLEEYLSSPLGRVYLLIGATVGYFA